MSIDYAKLGFRQLQDEEEKNKEIDYESLGMRPVSEEDDYTRFKGTTAKGALKAIGRGAVSGLTTVSNIGQMLAEAPGQLLLGLGELNLPEEARKIPKPSKERVSEYLSQQEGDDILPQVMLPSGHEIGSFITGTPENYQAPFGERLLEGGTEALTSAPTFGMSPMQAILPFGGSFVAKELGGGTLAQLGAGLGAGGVHIAGSMGKDLVKNAYSSVKEKGVIGALGELGAKFSKVKPEAEALFAATEGAAPLSSMVDSKVVNLAESILAKYPASADSYVQQAEKTTESFRKSFANTLEKHGVDPKASLQDSVTVLDNAVQKGIQEAETELKNTEDQLVKSSSKVKLTANKSYDVATKEAELLGTEAKSFLPTTGKSGKVATQTFNPIKGMIKSNTIHDLPLANRISDAISTAETGVRKQEAQAWAKFETEVPKTAVIKEGIGKELSEDIKTFLEEVNANKENLTPHDKNTVINFANNVSKLSTKKVSTGIFDAQGNPITKSLPVTVRSLIDARKMANSIYGGDESYRKLALVIKDKIDVALEKWALENKEASFLHKDAVRQSRERFQNFSWPVKKISHRDTINKEGQLGFFRKQSGLEALKKILPKEEFEAIQEAIGDQLLSKKFGKKALKQYLTGKEPETAAQAMLHDLHQYEGIVPSQKIDELRNALQNVRSETAVVPGTLGKGKGEITVEGNKIIDTIFKLEQKLKSGKLTPTERKAHEDFLGAIYEDINESAGNLKDLVSKRNASKDTLTRLTGVFNKDGGIQSYIKTKLKTEKGAEQLKRELKNIPGASEFITQGQKTLLAEELEKTVFSKGNMGKQELNHIRKLYTDPEMKNLIGKDGTEALKTIHDNAAKIIDSVNFYANPSQTEHLRQGKAHYTMLGYGLYKLGTTGNPLPLIKMWGANKAVESLSKLLTNTEFKRALLDASKKIAKEKSGSPMVKTQLIRLGKQMAQVSAKTIAY